MAKWSKAPDREPRSLIAGSIQNQQFFTQDCLKSLKSLYWVAEVNSKERESVRNYFIDSMKQACFIKFPTDKKMAMSYLNFSLVSLTKGDDKRRH